MPDNKMGSGRTHRMLNAAFRATYDGGRVAVVLHSLDMVGFCMAHLIDLGAQRNGAHGAKVGEDGFITFVSMNRDDLIDWEMMRLRGWKEDKCFFDHQVIYARNRRVIDLWTKYD